MIIRYALLVHLNDIFFFFILHNNGFMFCYVFEHPDGEMHLLPGLSGSSELVLEAELAGGEGESSWQHSQLFRRSLNEPEESSLEILVEMEEDA